MKKNSICAASILLLWVVNTAFAFEIPDSVSNFREISPKEHRTILKSVVKKSETSLDFFNKEVQVTFPVKSIPDAFQVDAITIEAVKVDAPASRFASDFKSRSDIVSFTPSMKFSAPVLLQLHYTPDPGSDENRYNIFYLNEDTGRFEEMERISIDTENNLICARIRHFSSYVVGESSYKVTPGMSNHSRFFANNRERVLETTGTLVLNRQVLSIPGRAGLDLNLTAEFNSTDFFHTMVDSFPEWKFESMYEEKGYPLAAGWRWNLPRIFCKDPEAGDTPAKRKFFYFPGDGQRFELPLDGVKDRSVGAEIKANGCTIFVKEKPAANCYRIVIEIAELKTVIKASVVSPGTASAKLYVPFIYLPDGNIAELISTNGSNAGYIDTLSDAAGLNEIHFTYHSDGRIDRITDSCARIFSFTYNSANKLESIDYDGKAYRMFSFSGNNLAGCSDLVESTASGNIYQTTTYTKPTTTNLSLAICYPTGAESVNSFGNLYNSGSTNFISYPGCAVYLNSYTYQPVVRTSTLKENHDAAEYKTVTYDYMGGKMYTDSAGTQTGVAYYSLIKENNFTETTASAWRPWLNYAIKFYNEVSTNGSTFQAATINGEVISGFFTDSEYCILRTEVADTLRKTASCYNYSSGVLKGVEREIMYVKNGSAWTIDKMTVNTFKDINTYSDYFQINKSSIYHNPANDINPGTSQYYTGSSFDDYGRAVSTTDAVGNITQHSYIYPNNMSGTKADGASYSNTLNKFDLMYKITGKQKSGLEFIVDQETYFYYDDNTRNVMKVRKKKKSYDGSSISDVNTLFCYDPATNNLLSITDPMTHVLSLEYDSTYDAYVAKDIRTISPVIELDGGIIVSKIVNEFSYDNLGRLLSKRTGYIDASGNAISTHTSETTNYRYDSLDRVIEVATGTGLMKYVYADAAKTLTVYSLVENLGGNSYLAIKSFQQFDGLDRKIAEETSRLNISLDSSHSIIELTVPLLVSKKAFEYHTVFTDKVKKTTLFEDETTTVQITETSFENYGRPVQISSRAKSTDIPVILKKISYDDAGNITTEKNYRDSTNYTLKKVKKDWNGNTATVFEWNTVSPAGDTGTALKTTYSYDAFGNMIKMVNPASETFYYYYNTLGQLEKTIYNKGITRVETYELSMYDNNGNPVEFTDRIGNKMIREYNSLGQAVSVKTYTVSDLTNPETVTTTIYGQFGTPIAITRTDAAEQRDFKYKYTYNSLGQLAQFDQFIGSEADCKHYSITNTYDLAGNLDTTKLWNGEPGSTLIKALDYDPMAIANESAVHELTDAGKGDLLAKVKTKLWGGIASIEYGTSSVMTTTYGYNSLMQPTSITNNGRMELIYSYDLQGNVTSWKNGTPKTYVYDSLDRLLTETSDSITDKYSYDAIGNRTAIDKGNNGTNDVTYAYNSTKKMQLDSYTDYETTWTFIYDANGNMRSKSNGTESWLYTYNASNQLVEVQKNGITIGQYEYDSNGLRIMKIEGDTSTYYIYNGQSILFEETYNTTDTLEKSEYNIELNQMNLAKYTRNTVDSWQLSYHLNDHLGSRQVVCDVNGTGINNGKYGTFGQYESGAENDYCFTGKKIDSFTGFSYFNQRYYLSELARFITLDPIKSGNNYYIYCENNPLKYIDSNGLELKPAIGSSSTYRNNIESAFTYLSQSEYANSIIGYMGKITNFTWYIQEGYEMNATHIPPISKDQQNTTITWNDNIGYSPAKGGVISAARVLMHELLHGYLRTGKGNEIGEYICNQNKWEGFDANNDKIVHWVVSDLARLISEQICEKTPDKAWEQGKWVSVPTVTYSEIPPNNNADNATKYYGMGTSWVW